MTQVQGQRHSPRLLVGKSVEERELADSEAGREVDRETCAEVEEAEEGAEEEAGTQEETGAEMETETETGLRALRMRTSLTTSSAFSFRPELVQARGVERVRDFLSACRAHPSLWRVSLDLQEQLLPFGYSLMRWQGQGQGGQGQGEQGKEGQPPSLFAPWEFQLPVQ
jgi:hypothetical protein